MWLHFSLVCIKNRFTLKVNKDENLGATYYTKPSCSYDVIIVYCKLSYLGNKLKVTWTCVQTWVMLSNMKGKQLQCAMNSL